MMKKMKNAPVVRGKVEYVLVSVSCSNSLRMDRDFEAGVALTWQTNFYEQSIAEGALGCSSWGTDVSKARRFPPSATARRIDADNRLVRLVNGVPVDLEEKRAELIAAAIERIKARNEKRRLREAAKAAAQ